MSIVFVFVSQSFMFHLSRMLEASLMAVTKIQVIALAIISPTQMAGLKVMFPARYALHLIFLSFYFYFINFMSC